MNICTYVTPVSMQPKRYMVALYHGTQSLQNIYHTDTAVLQFLSVSQYRLVNQLGKVSGKEIDKVARLEKRKLITEWKGFPVLKEALSLIRLQKRGYMEAGDHVCFFFDVVDHQNRLEGSALDLYTLKKYGMIRS